MASAPHLDRHQSHEMTCSAWDGDSVLVPVRRELFGDAIGARETFGVAMCLLPIDISLRAYAIEAIRRVVAGQGLAVAGWRDVPVCSPGVNVHIAQLVVTPGNDVDGAAFELQLTRVQEVIEGELALMGMCDDARVISCSRRSIRYPLFDGATPPAVLYPDLAGDALTMARPFRDGAEA